MYMDNTCPRSCSAGMEVGDGSGQKYVLKGNIYMPADKCLPAYLKA